LVFPNGGVIRLSVPVAPGQLLFLTNQETRREVVTQVMRRRNNPSAGYYVELEFTEPSLGFWGIEFPEDPEAVQAAPQKSAAAEIMQSAPASDEPDPQTQAPSADEVEALMEEVEALRAQLRSMQTQAPVTPAQPAAALHPSPSSSAPTSVPAAGHTGPDPQLAALFSSVLSPSAVAPPASPKTESAHSSPSEVSAPRSQESQGAAGKTAEADDEELLPKPALDFKKAKTPKQTLPVNTPPPASDSSGLLRLLLLAAVSLFAVSVAAWQLHWLPWSSAPARDSDGASSSGRPATRPVTARPAAQKSTAPANVSAASASATASPQPTSLSSAGASNNSRSDATPSSSTEPTATAADASASPASHEESAPVTPVAKRSVVRSSVESEPASVADSGAAIVPPKLIKSVRAVAPGDALRQFVTGNVTLDALIDKNGEVKSMKVLSGPASFHKAAMEALKQYRYEPARQNGRPVSAHITVTVPFWFEP
jgi:TonB family protein